MISALNIASVTRAYEAGTLSPADVVEEIAENSGERAHLCDGSLSRLSIGCPALTR